jgi:hypothetical protein
MDGHLKISNAQKKDLVNQMGIEKSIYHELHERFMNVEKENQNLQRRCSDLYQKEIEYTSQKQKLLKERDQILLEKNLLRKNEMKRNMRPVYRRHVVGQENEIRVSDGGKKLEEDIARIAQRTKSRKVELKRYDSDDSD